MRHLHQHNMYCIVYISKYMHGVHINVFQTLERESDWRNSKNQQINQKTDSAILVCSNVFGRVFVNGKLKPISKTIGLRLKPWGHVTCSKILFRNLASSRKRLQGIFQTWHRSSYKDTTESLKYWDRKVEGCIGSEVYNVLSDSFAPKKGLGWAALKLFISSLVQN